MKDKQTVYVPVEASEVPDPLNDNWILVHSLGIWLKPVTLPSEEEIDIPDDLSDTIEEAYKEGYIKGSLSTPTKPVVTEEEIVPIIDEWTRKSFGRKILNVEYKALAKAILTKLNQ